MKVFVVLVLALASASAGLLPQQLPQHPKDRVAGQSIEGRITNGYTATAGQFPYQVGLAFTGSNGGWWCGGSIISNEWVVTAAHCTNGATSVSISFGATDRTEAKLTLVVSSSYFKQHPSYLAVTIRNDISLIEIPSVSFTNYINKIALPAIAASYPTYTGKTAIASGWGLVSDSATSVAQFLQYVDLEVIPNTDCADVYGNLVVTDRVVCVKTPNAQSTCSGDSGGPLALAGTLIGITSFGSSSGCEKGYPAAFTRVTYYLDWIKENSGVTGNDS